MLRIITTVSLLSLLSACGGGQPFDFSTTDSETDEDPNLPDQDSSTLENGTDRPADASEPSARRGIVRFEADDGKGGGYVSDVSYNVTDDTFSVDNLAFDGENIYQRSGTINGFSVFAADAITPDSLTGADINQIPYRAVFGESVNRVDGDAQTSFAIVRSAGYRDYGFGGFVYERNGGVTLPASGQAKFNGDYAGVRIFEGRPRLEYTTGNMTMNIDFDDFNSGDAIKGAVTDREVFDINGNPLGTLPYMGFVIQAGEPTITSSGEISGNVFSTTPGPNGTSEIFESGTYYGVIAGDVTQSSGGEIVGVIVVESKDPIFETTVQETGGFVLYR